MLQSQSQVQAELSELPGALQTLDQALNPAPDGPALLHNCATLSQRSHRPVQALQCHECALALGLNAADAHYNHGNTLRSLGRHHDAVAAYKRALQRLDVLPVP